jgi:hypothetical protein
VRDVNVSFMVLNAAGPGGRAANCSRWIVNETTILCYSWQAGVATVHVVAMISDVSGATDGHQILAQSHLHGLRPIERTSTLNACKVELESSGARHKTSVSV